MTTKPTDTTAPRRRRRRWLIYLPAGLAVCVAVAYCARGLWLQPLLRHALETWAARALSAQLQIAEIRGSYWRDLTLSQVTWAAAERRTTATIERLELRYDPWSLLHGSQRFIERLTVAVSSAEIDLGAAAARSTDLPALPKLPAPPVLPALVLQDINVHYSSQDWQLHLLGIEARGRATGAAMTVHGVVSGSYRDAPVVRAPVDLEWQWQADGIRAHLCLGREAASALTAELYLSDRRSVELRLAHPASGGHLEVACRTRGRQLTADLSGAGIQLESLPGLTTPLLIAGQLDPLEIHLDVDRQKPHDSLGTAELRIRDLRVGPLTAELVALQAEYHDGELRVPRCDLVADRGYLHLRHLQLPTTGGPGAAERLRGLDVAAFAVAVPSAYLRQLEQHLPMASALMLERLSLHGRIKDGDLSLPAVDVRSELGSLKVRGGRVKFGPNDLVPRQVSGCFELSVPEIGCLPGPDLSAAAELPAGEVSAAGWLDWQPALGRPTVCGHLSWRHGSWLDFASVDADIEAVAIGDLLQLPRADIRLGPSRLAVERLRTSLAAWQEHWLTGLDRSAGTIAVTRLPLRRIVPSLPDAWQALLDAGISGEVQLDHRLLTGRLALVHPTIGRLQLAGLASQLDADTALPHAISGRAELRLTDISPLRPALPPQFARLGLDGRVSGPVRVEPGAWLDFEAQLESELAVRLADHGTLRILGRFTAADGMVSAQGATFELAQNRALADLKLPLRAGVDWLAEAAAGVQVDIREPAAFDPWLTLPPQLADLVHGSRLQGAVTLTDGAVALQLDMLETPLGQVSGAVRLAGGPPGDYLTRPISGELRATVPALMHCGRWLPNLPPVTGAADCRLAVSGTLAQPACEVRLEAADLSVARVPLGHGRLTAAVSPSRLEVTDLKLTRGANTIAGGGTIDLRTGAWQNVQVRCNVDDCGAYLPDLPRRLSGRLALRAATAGHWPALVTDIDLDLTQMRLDNRELPELALRAQHQGQFTADGTQQVTLHELALHYRGGTLSLASPATLGLVADHMIQVDRLDLRGELGDVLAAGRLSWRQDCNLRFKLTPKPPLARLAALAGVAMKWQHLQAAGQLTGRWPTPKITLKAAAVDLSVADLPAVTGQLHLTQEANSLRLLACDFQAGQRAKLALTGEFPWRLREPTKLNATGTLALDAAVELADGALLNPFLARTAWALGAAQARVKLSGSLAAATGSVLLQVHDLTVPSAATLQLPPLSGAITLQIAEGRQLEISEAVIEGEDVALDLSGSWRSPGFLGRLLQCRAPDPGQLRGEISLQLAALPLLLEPTARETLIAGSLEAVLQVSGSATAPQWQGRMQVAGGRLRLAPEFPALNDLQLSATLAERSIAIDGLSGKLGAEPLTGTGSIALLPTGAMLDLRAAGANLLLYRNDGIKLRADCNLQLAGLWSAPLLSGDVRIVDGRISRDVELLGSLRNLGTERGTKSTAPLPFSAQTPPLRDLQLGLRVTAERPIVVQNNAVKGGFRADLRLTGTGQLPQLTGTIDLEPTRIALPSGRLQLEQGQLRFRGANVNQAEIQVDGHSRLMGYEIAVSATGSAAAPALTLTSSPPLATEEILWLLLTGRPPAVTAEADGRANRRFAFYLARSQLQDWLGDTEGAELIDRLELEIGHNITRAGQDAISGRFRLADGLILNHDVFYLTAERDVYDAYNAGLRLVIRRR